MKNKIHSYVLALGHGCSDINQSILSAVLPFLIASYHFDYATASLLVMISNIVGSIVQPIFGNIADKKNQPWIIIIGVSLASIGMALTGFLSSFIGLSIAVMISGIGVALFHPQAAQLVDRSSNKNKKGQGISIFSFGGKMGFTIGPILTAFAINTFGMKGTIIFLAPAMIFSCVSSRYIKDFKELGEQEKSEKQVSQGNEEKIDQWGSFAKLCIVVFGRSIITNGMATFLALYLIGILGMTSTTGNTMLSVYYGIGAFCTLMGGNLGDRFGHKRIIRFSFVIFIPSLFIFTMTNNIAIAIALLIPLACSESLSYSPMVVLGQRYLPNHTGFASGVTLGLAVSIGAIVVPVLGWLSDMYTLKYALYGILLFATISLVFSLLLPKEKQIQTTL